jgi:hypothetical protein
MKGATLEEISHMVDQISREYRSKQAQLQPLTQELKVNPVLQHVVELFYSRPYPSLHMPTSEFVHELTFPLNFDQMCPRVPVDGASGVHGPVVGLPGAPHELRQGGRGPGPRAPNSREGLQLLPGRSFSLFLSCNLSCMPRIPGDSNVQNLSCRTSACARSPAITTCSTWAPSRASSWTAPSRRSSGRRARVA